MKSGAASTGAAVAAALERSCDSGAMQSGAVGLIMGGRITTVATAGEERPGGPKAGTSTRFGLGSVTKLLTAIAVARSGHLEFDQPVAASIPEETFDDAASFEKVTIADILANTSGLPFLHREDGPRDDGALGRFVGDDLAHHRFHTTPGELALDSPSPYSLIGRMLEIADGLPFEEVLTRSVMQPAGMSTAVFPQESEDFDGVGDDRSQHPSGFLLASVEDVLQLAKAIVEGWLIDGDAWRRMTTQRVSRHISHIGYPLALVGSGYGLGCQVGTWNGQQVARHPGRQWSYQCSVDVLPEAGSAVVLLTKGADDSTFNEVLSLSYEAVGGSVRFPPEPGLESVSELHRESWVGAYVHPSRGTMIHIDESDGDLVYRSGEVTAPLYHLGKGRALVPMSYGSAPVWFPPLDGAAPYLKVWGEAFFREEARIWSPSDPARFRGAYRDAFWPDPTTDIEVATDGETWSFARGDVRFPGTVLTERRIATALGVVELADDGSGFQVGNAARFIRS